MTRRLPTDMAASVRQRLANLAHQTQRPLGEVLQYYAIERFLARLSCSAHADRFILKGATLLLTWDLPTTRPTRDIDVLARTENTVPNLVSLLRDVCSTEVEPDGIEFDPESVAGQAIREAAEYAGVRVSLTGHLGVARLHLQIDSGFGDRVLPGPQCIRYPTLLGTPEPRLRGYSRESVIAEKLETMVKLGVINSRMKDFFDVWQLSRAFPFDGCTLSRAIEATFRARGTPLNPYPTCFTAAFSDAPDKQAQWEAFLRRSRLDGKPVSLPEVVAAIRSLIAPLLAALAGESVYAGAWTPPGPWHEADTDAEPSQEAHES